MNREVTTEREVSPTSDLERTTTNTQEPANAMAKFVYFVFSVIIGLLTLRFIFALFGANPNSGFVDFIYTLTQPLVAPFQNIFNTNADIATVAGSRFEVETIVAIIIYGLIAWGISQLMTVFDRRVKA